MIILPNSSVRQNARLFSAIARFRETIEHEAELHFRLKYDGLLLSSSDRNTRVKNKNQIRWYLADQIEDFIMRGDFSRLPESSGHFAKERLKIFKGCGFFSAISKGPIACNLTIGMERRESPGSLFEHDGDLDNRLKTLFDALKVPRNENEVTDPPSLANGKVRSYCACLFEDDSMITGLHITTVPSLESLPRNHVRITIDVEIKAHDLMFDSDS